MSRASRTHRPLVTREVAIFTHNSVNVQSLLHLLSRELHHVVSTTLSTSCPSSAEVTSLVSSCTRQSSVFNAKTRSSVPSAPLNRHYQCTHEFSRVSGHFTHCWAYRPVYREMNSLVVKVSKLVHFQPDFRSFAHAVLNSSRTVCFQ